MRYELSFDLSAFEALKGSIKGNFDNPKRNASIVTNKVFFSGWFLVENNNVYLKIKDKNGQFSKCYLNVDRPDVINHFGLSSNQITCGFQFSLDLDTDLYGDYFDVSVCVNDFDYDVWKVVRTPFSKAEIYAAKNCWESFYDNSQPYSSLTEIHALNLSNILTSLFSISDSNTIYNDFISCMSTLFDSSQNFEEFVNMFKDPNWAMNAIESAVESGVVSLELKSKAKFYCVGSYMVEDFNFILFSGAGFYFYIVQHCANVLMIFPTFYRCISLNIDDWARHATNKIGLMFQSLVMMRSKGIVFPNKIPSRFYGVNISQSRPYHYVYDYLHGIEFLHSKGLLFSVFSNSGFDFMNLADIFPNITSYSSVDQDDFNKVCSIENLCLVMPCLQYVNGTHDRGLLALSEKMRSIHASSEISLCEFDFVFWVGISIEKRQWIEQVEGISNIIESLKLIFNKICVIVDGRTAKLSKNGDDERLVLKEKCIYDDIKSSVRDVFFIDLIGRKMSEKISLASYVDLFLTSYATDSMYASCIQQKIGIVYIAPSIGEQRKLHVHHSVIQMPDAKVKEVRKEGRAWHETSVSMDWRDVYECIEQALNRGD